MNRFLILASAALVTLSACSKSVDSPQSASEDLRSGTWVRTSIRIAYKDPKTRGDSNVLYTQPTCWGDNSLTFQTSDQGILSLGTTVCTPSDPPTKNFTWQVTQNETHLSLYGVQDYFPTNNVDATIITRTLGFLSLQYSVVHADTLYHTFDTVTYTDVLQRH